MRFFVESIFPSTICFYWINESHVAHFRTLPCSYEGTWAHLAGRVSFAGITLGDVWPCAVIAQRALEIHTNPAGDTPPTAGVNLGSIAGAVEQTKPEIIVPFHKLTR